MTPSASSGVLIPRIPTTIGSIRFIGASSVVSLILPAGTGLSSIKHRPGNNVPAELPYLPRRKLQVSVLSRPRRRSDAGDDVYHPAVVMPMLRAKWTAPD